MSNAESVTGQNRFSTVLLFTVILGLLALQYFASLRYTEHSQQVLTELRSLDERRLAEEKIRQEAIAARVKNEEQSVFLSTLVTNFSALTGILVAITGAWIGLTQFLDLRRKESFERAAMEFNKLWEGLSQSGESERTSSIAGLQVFLRPDARGFHGRVASALAVCTRQENAQPSSGIVAWTLAPVLQQLVRVSPEEFRRVSWRGCKLEGIDFSAVDLSGIDFRDANLLECNFTKSVLRGARFDAARLQGCNFEGARLEGACLDYADLAYASIRNADLSSATLSNLKLLNLEMQGADLRSAKVSAYATDWRLARDWRNARMEPELAQKLLAENGPAASGPHVLMLLWEFPPFVSGGQWTAAYHLLRNLRKKGARITVLVPVAECLLSSDVFGNEIDVVGADVLGVEFTGQQGRIGGYGGSGTGAYGGSGIGAYGGSGWSGYTAGGLGGYAGKRIFQYIRRFAARLPEIIDDRGIQFDLIHAHDWLTFEAAESIARCYGKPWIAHFHSLERDRTDQPSHFIEDVEALATRQCARIVTPSAFTRQRLVDIYRADADKIQVIPNCLSTPGRASVNIGYRQSNRVVYTGRLSRQKGPDRFLQIAKSAWGDTPGTTFILFGGGSNAEIGEIESNKYLAVRRVPKPLAVPAAASYKLARVNIRSIAVLNKDNSFGEVFQIQDSPPARTEKMTADDEENYQFAMQRWEEQKTFLNSIFANGFTVYALEERIGGFEHKLVLPPDDKGNESVYLVRIDGDQIATTNRWTERVAELGGALIWEERETAFDDASVVVVPSRYEPFGMVVLEAMQHGVPVLYPQHAGAAEVLRSGIRFDPEKARQSAHEIHRLLREDGYWEQVVNGQYAEIEGYSQRGYENLLTQLWETLTPASPSANGAAAARS